MFGASFNTDADPSLNMGARGVVDNGGIYLRRQRCPRATSTRQNERVVGSRGDFLACHAARNRVGIPPTSSV